MQNILDMDDSDAEGRDKDGNAVDKIQLRMMEENAVKGNKKDKKRKRLENKGIKLDTDSDVNSDDIQADSGDENELLGDKKKNKKEEDPEHKPMKKSPEEIKKSLFLGEKYGHYKIGSYVQIDLAVEKKFSRQLEPEYPIVLCSLKH